MQKCLNFTDKTELLSLERAMNEKEESIPSWGNKTLWKKIPLAEVIV